VPFVWRRNLFLSLSVVFLKPGGMVTLLRDQASGTGANRASMVTQQGDHATHRD